MVEVVKSIVTSLVDGPEDVEVVAVEGSHSTIIEVDVHPDDRGKIIGRKGTIAAALRTILKAASGKDKKRYILEIIEDDDDFGDEPEVPEQAEAV